MLNFTFSQAPASGFFFPDTMAAPPNLLVAIFFLVFASVASAASEEQALAAEQCTDKGTCAACAKEGAGGINGALNIPMMNSRLTMLSHDLSAYDLSFLGLDNRTGITLDRKKLFAGQDTLLDVLAFRPYLDDPKHIFNYAEGVAAYPAFALLLMVASGIAFGIFFMARFCCCCCCRGGGCGGSYPSPTCCGCRWCWLRLDDADDKYPMVQKVATHCCATTFICCMWLFMALGQFGGNTGLTQGMYDLAEKGPTPAADLMSGLAAPTSNLLLDVVGKDASGLLEGTRSVLATNLDTAAIKNDLTCLSAALDGMPDPATTKALLSKVQTALNEMPSPASTKAAMDNMVATLDALPARVDDLKTALDKYAAGTTTVKQDLDDISTAIAGIKGDAASMKSDLGTIIGTLNLVSTNLKAADVRQLSTDIAAMADKGCSDGCSGAPAASAAAWRTQLKGDVNTQKDRFANIAAADPTLTATADLIGTATAALDAMSGKFDTLSTEVASIDTALKALPAASSTQALLTGLETDLANFDADAAVAVLKALNASVAGFPQPTQITAILGKVSEALDSVPCLERIGAEIAAVNRTIVRLPSAVGQATQQIEQANATLQAAVAGTAGFSDGAKALNETLNGPVKDIGTYLQYVEDLRTARSDITTKVNFTKMREQVAEFEAVGTTTVPAMNTEIAAAKAKLTDPKYRPPAAATNGLRTLDTQSSGMSTKFADLLTAITTWEDAGAAKAQVPDTSTITADLNAAATDMESFDAGALATDLQALHDQLDTITSQADLTGQVDSAKALLAAFDPTALQGDLTKAKQDLAAIPDLSSIQGQLTDFDAKIKQFNDSLPVIYDNIDTLNQTVSGIREPLRTATTVATWADGFLATELPKVIQRSSRAALASVYGGQGLSGLMLEVADIVDDVYANVRESGLLSNESRPLNVKQSIQAVIPAIASVEDKDKTLRKHGSLFYILSILQSPSGAGSSSGGGGGSSSGGSSSQGGGLGPTPSSAQKTFFEGSGNANDQVFKRGSDGKPWNPYNGEDGGRYCMSDLCLRNTIKSFNTESVQDFSEQAVPIPLSRETLMLLPFLFPLLLTLLAMISCIFRLSCPSMFTVCCISWMVPWMLLSVGMFSFPMTIVGADVCLSIPNVATDVATNFGPALCSYAGGTMDTRNEVERNVCKVTVDIGKMANGGGGGGGGGGGSSPISLPSATTFSFDVRQLARQLVGDADRCGEAGGELAKAWTILSQLGSTYPSQLATEFLQGMREGKFGEVQLRPALEQQVTLTASGLGTSLGASLSPSGGVGDSKGFAQTIDCAGLNAAFNGIKEGACCGVGTAGYWYAASWYLMIFAMLSCGCCSGIMGFKRYAREPGAWRDRKRGVLTLQEIRAPDGLIVAVPAEVIPPPPAAEELPPGPPPPAGFPAGLQGHSSATVHENPLRVSAAGQGGGDGYSQVTIEMAGSYEKGGKIPLQDPGAM